jgi:hypothetical protein
MAVALDEGFILGEKYEGSVIKACQSIKNYVKEDGTVLNSCEGPGPLYSIKPYLNEPAPPDEEHGAQAIIRAMTAELILQ